MFYTNTYSIENARACPPPSLSDTVGNMFDVANSLQRVLDVAESFGTASKDTSLVSQLPDPVCVTHLIEDSGQNMYSANVEHTKMFPWMSETIASNFSNTLTEYGLVASVWDKQTT